MRITKQQLRRIIREEIEKRNSEDQETEESIDEWEMTVTWTPKDYKEPEGP